MEKISKTIEAIQFRVGEPLPDGLHECMPEVMWAHGRNLVYFTYAALRPRHWMGVEKKQVPQRLDSVCVYEPSDGEPYARDVYPFATYKVKSECSIKRDYSAVYLDRDDNRMISLWHDYCSLEQFPNPIPRYAEYREPGEQYGRGYAPHYLADRDWLLKEPGENGVKIRVVSDEEFERLKAA